MAPACMTRDDSGGGEYKGNERARERICRSRAQRMPVSVQRVPGSPVEATPRTFLRAGEGFCFWRPPQPPPCGGSLDQPESGCGRAPGGGGRGACGSLLGGARQAPGGLYVERRVLEGAALTSMAAEWSGRPRLHPQQASSSGERGGCRGPRWPRSVACMSELASAACGMRSPVTADDFPCRAGGLAGKACLLAALCTALCTLHSAIPESAGTVCSAIASRPLMPSEQPRRGRAGSRLVRYRHVDCPFIPAHSPLDPLRRSRASVRSA